MNTQSDHLPELLALDWGTSSLRAFLLGKNGAVVDSRSSEHGIQNLPQPGEAGFRQAFAEIAGDWLHTWPQLPVVAGGMVGSAQGWREAPYTECPTTLEALAYHGVAVDTGLAGKTMLIAPGLIHRPAGAAPDVLRGEEIQIAGALVRHAEWYRHSRIVLPGTHSKWVEIEHGGVKEFATYMTGELFALLAKHSILGRLLNDDEAPPEEAREAFELGIQTARAGRPGELSHQLFAVRTFGLAGRFSGAALKDYLSGLLIGNELVCALAVTQAPTTLPLLLIGEGGLCKHYLAALSLFGIDDVMQLGNTAPAGLFQFARAAGLVSHSSEETA